MARVIDMQLVGGGGASCDLPARRLTPLTQRGLAYSPDVAARVDVLYEQVKDFLTPAEWPLVAPLVDGILRLKAERGAVILAHNYMTADIFNLVGDFRGDSLQLAREAARTSAKVIVQAGVHFMAETSKILSPEKTVLIPDLRAGCSLASSITGADVRLIKAAHAGVPVVTYVNTSADVKAETDICCTSSNAVQVVEWAAREWGSDRVILIPDEYLARNVAAQTGIKIITWHGRCEVHERFTAEDIAALREAHPGVVVLAHPECPPDVMAAADYAGSTAALADYVGKHSPRKVVLLTECSMSDNVAAANPGVDFVRPCNLCPHMKRITLENIYDCLVGMQHEVDVPETIRVPAKRAIDAMLALPRTARPLDFEVGLPNADVVVM